MKIRNLDVIRNPSNDEHQRLGLPPVEATGRFPMLDLVTINTFGGWAQKTRFADGGVFDQLHAK